MATFYISSTFTDLKEHREEVCQTLRKMRHNVLAMEDYVASHIRPLQVCLDDVASSDIYVGIFAWRYGFKPKDDNPESKAITELEYLHAVSNNKPCLIFMTYDDAPWNMAHVDRGEDAERIHALRAKLRENHIVGQFRTKEELAREVSVAANRCLVALASPRAAAAPVAQPALAAPVATLPSPGEPSPKVDALSPIAHKLCNRTNQVTKFAKFFLKSLEQPQTPPQICFIHGGAGQAHDSLIDRLVHTVIKPAVEKRWTAEKGIILEERYGWAYEGGLEELQDQLKYILFQEIDPAHTVDDLSATAYSGLPPFKEARIVIVRHQVTDTGWNKLTPDLIRWYLDYWRAMENDPLKARFLIFISLVYPKAGRDLFSKLWSRLKAVNKEAIESALEEIARGASCPCLLLDEIEPVSTSHIKDWFHCNGNFPPDIQNRVTGLLLRGDKESVDMEDVERELKVLVEASQPVFHAERGLWIR